jgi:hypothetical protein
MGKSEIVNVTGAAGEERLDLVLEVASRPFSIRVLEPEDLASIQVGALKIENRVIG